MHGPAQHGQLADDDELRDATAQAAGTEANPPADDDDKSETRGPSFGWKTRVKAAVVLSFLVLIGVQIAGRLGPTKNTPAPKLAINAGGTKDQQPKNVPPEPPTPNVKQTALVTSGATGDTAQRESQPGGGALMDLTSQNVQPPTPPPGQSTLEPPPALENVNEPTPSAPPIADTTAAATAAPLALQDPFSRVDVEPVPTPASEGTILQPGSSPSADAPVLQETTPTAAPPPAESARRVSPRDLTLVAPPDSQPIGEPRTEPPPPSRPINRATAAPPADLVGGHIEPITHVVRRGENFWTIARHYYGSGRYYRALWKANEEKVPKIDELYIGTPIVVPAPEQLDRGLIESPGRGAARATQPRSDMVADRGAPRDDELVRASGQHPAGNFEGASAATTPKSRPNQTYMSKSGDTLRSIAARELGDARRDEELQRLNTDLIDDPSDIPAGTLLRMPPSADDQ